MDPSPDYDMSDEIEFFFRYVPWGLRGVVDGNGYPPPAYPPAVVLSLDVARYQSTVCFRPSSNDTVGS